MAELLDQVETLLTTAGITETVYQHHANVPEDDHVLLTVARKRTRTDDALEEYFDDTVRVRLTVNYVDPGGEIEDVLTKRDLIVSTLAKMHLNSDIILSSIIDDPEPVRNNSKQWFWQGLFQMKGCFT